MARSIYDFDENQFDIEDHFEFLVPYEEGIIIHFDIEPKLNLHKTIITRSGRLLNVFCTFNLCPVFSNW